MTNLLDLAADLVAMASPSREEAAIADLVEARLARSAHLVTVRIGDNLVAKTNLGRPRRVVVAGHLDTVSTGAPQPRIEADVLWGLGAADMKGTIAVMLDLAASLVEPAYDVTWVFYAREEIARVESGLLEIAAADPTLLEGDVAILGEPTADAVEAGCQGTLRVEITVGGIEAHSARPFMGINAVHRAAAVIEAIANASPRIVEIDGVTFEEQIQVVGVGGGAGGNVVPGKATVVVNHRFAPDRDVEEALGWVEGLVTTVLDESQGESLAVLDAAPGARPHLEDPVIARLVALAGGRVAGKVGWTDVATFDSMGVAAVNFGAGDPLVAHHPDERVSAASLAAVHRTLSALLTDEMPSQS